jgi:hypothetical protein
MSDKTDRGFSADEARVLAGVLDDIIPRSPDGRLPGAGEIGLADFIAEALGKMPELRDMIVQGLSALDDLARRRTSQGFAALAQPDRRAVLNELASSEHAFPPVLILHTYAGYYRHPRVVAGLGLEPRPPHPKGYEMAPDDLTLLDAVRRRRPLYRTP